MKQLLIILMILCSAAGASADNYFSVMTYNVENLFDTIHDAEKRDMEFIPESERHWTGFRLRKKMKDICKVIAGADTVEACPVIGLCEVENDNVMRQLTEHTPLKVQGYKYVMTNSEDPRGIDVALLYKPDRFRLIRHKSIRAQTSVPTRDVLYVCGTMDGKDTLDIFLLHLPSKLGKEVAARNRKIVTMETLVRADSVFRKRQKATVIIMGDFNDELREEQMEPYRRYGFLDLTEGLETGSYKYKGEWSFIDHIMLRTSTSRETKARVVTMPFLLEKDKKEGGKMPRRMYIGPKYHGGVSDHLPVIVRLDCSDEKNQ